MSHAPQHSHNPCSLDPDEQIPAKIWELLRRNNRFKQVVTRLQELDKRPQLQDGYAARCPHEVGEAMVRRLGERNGFAGTALKWLVPEPLFEIRHVAIPAGVDLTGKKFVSLVTVKLQSGTTADPDDQEHWRTYESQRGVDAEGVANLSRRGLPRGPHLQLDRSDDPRFCSKVDPLKEWRDYFTDGRNFTLSTPWREAPAPFKREFCFLWRHCDSRTTNPITGTRVDAPSEHETTFFQGWSLLPAIGKNTVNQEDMARAWIFDNLAEDYRVFAFPKNIITRSEARRMADWLFCQLAANLPAREPEIYGSPLQWDVFLTVQDLMHEGASLNEALQESFENIHLKADHWHEGQPLPDQKNGWAHRGTDWQNTYRLMDSPLAGSGFVQTIFPGKPRTLPAAATVSVS